MPRDSSVRTSLLAWMTTLASVVIQASYEGSPGADGQIWARISIGNGWFLASAQIRQLWPNTINDLRTPLLLGVPSKTCASRLVLRAEPRSWVFSGSRHVMHVMKCKEDEIASTVSEYLRCPKRMSRYRRTTRGDSDDGTHCQISGCVSQVRERATDRNCR